jgi:hypothetical protein
MAWQPNTSNPVPSNVDKTKENKYFKDTKNLALDVRRDQDPKKDFTVTLLDIDTAIVKYVQDVINPTVIDAGESVKVPIIYGNPEKWNAAKNEGYLRDQQGKIQLPIIMLKRTSFNKNENMMSMNRYLSVPIITKFDQKNKYDRFSVLNQTVAPVNSVYSLSLPDHIKVEYEFMVWTEYVEQMNGILEKINFAAEDYWGDPQRFKFRVSINDYTNTTETPTEKDRVVRSTFKLSVFTYLLPESFEDRKKTMDRFLTPRKVSIVAETVFDGQMKSANADIKNNTYSNPSNPYYSIPGGPISSNGDSWRFPKPAIVTEKSTTEGGRVLEKIRQSYAALIQQTIVLQTSGSSSGSSIVWHTSPTTPNDYGEEGWMAYDGSYHYIYASGIWLRQSIDQWVA